MNKKFNFSDYFLILIVLIIINIIKNEKLLYPSILTLLNQKLILVVNNGIHFYDSNLENEDLDKLIPLNITTNCYQSCQHFYYFDESFNFHCTENETCPLEYNKLITDKKLCIKECINDDIYKFSL